MSAEFYRSPEDESSLSSAMSIEAIVNHAVQEADLDRLMQLHAIVLEKISSATQPSQEERIQEALSIIRLRHEIVSDEMHAKISEQNDIEFTLRELGKMLGIKSSKEVRTIEEHNIALFKNAQE